MIENAGLRDREGMATAMGCFLSWVLRFQMNGTRRDMGLGTFPDVGLAAARAATLQARGLIAQGIDPLEARREAERAARHVPTFREIAALVVADARRKTTNAKVAYQWERHLGPAYSGPLLERPVNEITTLDVAAVLQPVWRTKPEVARKLYPAIRRVFEYARIWLRDEHGIAIPANPARWDDLKAMGFEAPAQLSRGRHPFLVLPANAGLHGGFAGPKSRGGTAAGISHFNECSHRRGAQRDVGSVRYCRGCVVCPGRQLKRQ